MHCPVQLLKPIMLSNFLAMYHYLVQCSCLALKAVLSCPFECNKATIIWQIMQHLNASPPSCWFTFHSAFSNFMQKS